MFIKNGKIYGDTWTIICLISNFQVVLQNPKVLGLVLPPLHQWQILPILAYVLLLCKCWLCRWSMVFVRNLSPSTRSSPCHFSLFNASSLLCSLSSLQNSNHFLNFIPLFDFLEFGRGEFVLKFIFFFAKTKSHLGCPFV
jgi:hypothetical protein